MIKVVTVLITGPILLGLGILTIVAAMITHQPWVLAMGTALCGVCFLFFGLVNVLSWSPDEADVPFAMMGFVYTIISVVLCVQTRNRMRSNSSEYIIDN